MNFLTLLFPDLNAYDIEPCPKQKVIVRAETPTEQGDVLMGQKWKTAFNPRGFESDRVVSSKPGTRIETLTGWDVAYLDEYHKNAFTKEPTWKKTMAEVLKAEWATIMEDGEYPSAERVVKNHTAVGTSEPQKGFGLSNVKKYHHAFNDALKRETQEESAKGVK